MPAVADMDTRVGPSYSPATRVRQAHLAARLATLLSSSRAVSSGLFVILMVVADHMVAAADGYMNENLKGDYDPLVIACFESLMMLGIALLLYVAMCHRQWIAHREWIRRAEWRTLLAVAFLGGAQGVLWALSSRGVRRQYQESMAAITIPIVFLVRYGLFESYHVFHIMGGTYAALGLLVTAYSAESVEKATSSDVYYICETIVWALQLISMATWFERNKRMPIVGVLLVFLVVRMFCTTVGMVSLLGSGAIDGEAVLCLLAGTACSKAVPATLIGHALASFLRMVSVVIVVKYVGAPLTAVTIVTSTALQFYTRNDVASVDIAAAFLSVIGCAVFVHGQWALEASQHEEWHEQLRRATASTSLVESSSDGDDKNDYLPTGADDGPLVMREG